MTNEITTIARSYKYRCYPTAAQEALLTCWQETCWDIQRWAVQDRRWADRETRLWRYWREVAMLNPEIEVPEVEKPEPRSMPSQSRQFTELKKRREHWRIPPDDVARAILNRVDQAAQNLWKERRGGNWDAEMRWPRKPSMVGLTFRGQSRGTRLVSADGRNTRWHLSSSKKLGPIAVHMHRPIPAGADVRQVHITRSADGWYISFSCIIPSPPPAPPAKLDVVGVNLNCRHIGKRQTVARLDTGKEYQIDDTALIVQRRLGTLQKLVSRRKTRGSAKAADPASKRTAKRRERIARLTQRTTRQREHQQQFVAKRIIDTANVIVVEDTDYAKMARFEVRQHAHGERKAKRITNRTNRSMRRAAPGRTRQLLREKAEIRGREVRVVDAYNVSQICSVCGYECNPHITLDVVEWQCVTCGTRHHRDVNAARNIRKRAAE